MVLIKYGDIAAGAKEAFEPSLQNCATISNADNLTSAKILYQNFGNPCEDYSVLLDGNSLPIPSDTSEVNIGVWSDSVSDGMGAFENAPSVTLISDTPFDINGFTIYFDEFNGIYPLSANISIYLGSQNIWNNTYNCTSPQLVIQSGGQECDKIVITANGVNAPYTRVKIRGIIYGVDFQIAGRDINSIQITQQINPISSTVPISTADITFLNTSGADYDFSEQQQLDIYNSDMLIGRYFIDEATRITKQQWKIKAQDYISLLDSIDFEGGIYSGETVGNIAESIFAKASVKYTIDPELGAKTVTGHIPYTTCRKALQQLMFAACGYVRTAYSETVDLLQVGTEVRESIPLSGRILQGTQSATTDPDVTEIELTAHSYKLSNDLSELYSAQSDVDNVKIIFDGPVDTETLEFTEGDGEIIDCGANYAIITCSAGSILSGYEYEHIKISKTLTNAKAHTRKSNKKSITDATLISSSNIDEVLQMCYNYLIRTMTVSSKVVEGSKLLMVGERYEIDTEVWGKRTGINQEQSFALYGNKVAKNIKIK